VLKICENGLEYFLYQKKEEKKVSKQRTNVLKNVNKGMDPSQKNKMFDI
jgi:hypothetical protein